MGHATPSSRPATPSAARGTCSATRASAPTPTCSRSATRSVRGTARSRSPTAPSILQYIKDTAARDRASTSTSGSTTASCAADWSTDDARWHVTAERTDTGETVRAHRRLPVLVQRLLPLRPGLPARLRRHGPLPGHDRPPAGLARGPRLRRQAGRRDRQRRHRGHAHPVDGRDRRARHDAAALAHLHRLAARHATRSPACCARCCPTRWAGTRIRWVNALGTQAFFQLSQRRPGAREEDAAQGRRAPAARGLRRRHPLHAPLRPVGPAAVRRARRRPVQGDPRGPGVGRHRPHRHASPRPASRLAVGRPSSRPTSSSPPPASSCCSSAASR